VARMSVTPASLIGVVCSLLLIALGYVVLYFVVRLAVRHALQDTDSRRARSAPGYVPPPMPGPRA
jgi:hypothetical protein